MTDGWNGLGHELDRLRECPSLQSRPGAKPSRIQSTVLTACPAVMVDIFRDGVHKAPGGSLSGGKTGTLPFVGKEIDDFFHGALVALLW